MAGDEHPQRRRALFGPVGLDGGRTAPKDCKPKPSLLGWLGEEDAFCKLRLSC